MRAFFVKEKHWYLLCVGSCYRIFILNLNHMSYPHGVFLLFSWYSCMEGLWFWSIINGLTVCINPRPVPNQLLRLIWPTRNLWRLWKNASRLVDREISCYSRVTDPDSDWPGPNSTPRKNRTVFFLSINFENQIFGLFWVFDFDLENRIW